MNRDLVISSHQVYFGKVSAAREVMGVILVVADAITIGIVRTLRAW
jgi:hypothetical protein